MSNYLSSCNEFLATGHSGAATGRRAIQTVIHDGSLSSVLKAWIARSRQRRQLATLPTHLLADIGISAADATEEAAKPFWVA